MAYQHYDNDGRQYGGRHHEYVRIDRPARQSARFVDPYKDYAYTKTAPQGQSHRDYATYSYKDQATHANMDQDRYKSVPRGQAHSRHEGYTSRHSTSDYISPPVESRHDYILPEDNSSRRYTYQQSRSHENCGQYDEPYQKDYSHQHDTPKQSRYSEPRIPSSRPVAAEKSNYRILKDSGFDSKHDFMRTHGIKPWNLDAYDQANEILESFRHIDAHNQSSQNRRSRPEPELSQYPRPRSSHHRYEREVHRNSAQSQRPRSSHHKYERADHRDSARLDKDYGSDMETCIDSDVPEGGYISGSDIGSFKSTSSLDRYWSGSRSRSPSLHRRNSSGTGARIWRSVSKSSFRHQRSAPEYGQDVYDSDGNRDEPRGRYVSSSPLAGTRSRRFSSTLRRSRSRSRVLSSGSSILSYKSSRSPSIFAGSDYFNDHGGVEHRSRSGSPFAIDSGSDLSGSESGSEIESADEYDDDCLDDGFDEQIEDELEFDDY